MSVSNNIPQVAALKSAVEKVVGGRLQTHNAFIDLVVDIERTVGEHMSESTLERMWGYSTRECSSISVRTLNVLSRFAGSRSWEDFCEMVKAQSPKESEELEMARGCIDVSSLTQGARLQISWLPDRVITVEYRGQYRFEVLSSENSSICAGDSFCCLSMQPGRELYLDKFRRSGCDLESRYVVGQKSGITSILFI